MGPAMMIEHEQCHHKKIDMSVMEALFSLSHEYNLLSTVHDILCVLT